MITFTQFLENKYDITTVEKITGRIKTIIENINETLQQDQTEKPNKEAASAISFFTNLKNSINPNDIPNISPTQISQKIKDFKQLFESKYPEYAQELKTEAKNDAKSLKIELPQTTESILGTVRKGTEIIGKAALWATWKTVKFIILQILKVIVKIAKNIFTIHGKGMHSLVNICFAIIFPWLAFAQEPIFLIPAGIYYIIMTIGALFKVGEYE